MTAEESEPDYFDPLPPASFHILMVLARGENHGYGIMRAIDDDTDGRFRIGPGTLYGTIKRMLKAGWIEESDERPDAENDDERRRYYRLTDLGMKVTRDEAQRLSEMVAVARGARLLGGPASELPVTMETGTAGGVA